MGVREYKYITITFAIGLLLIAGIGLSSQEEEEQTVIKEVVIEKQAVFSQETKDQIDDLKKEIEELKEINKRQSEFIKTFEERMEFFQWQLTTYEDRLVEAQRRSAP
jgi:TolA-binding protein